MLADAHSYDRAGTSWGEGRKRLRISAPTKEDDKKAFEAKLVHRILGCVRTSDVGEDARRRHDRVGARMMYGQHYSKEMPADRAAIVANLGMSMLLHKVAIMSKQAPIPVIEPNDVGDDRGAELMRGIVMNVWKTSGMQQKSRRALTVAGATRTVALMPFWDPVMNGGAGGINTDVIRGWNLILDDRVSDPDLMEFAGHRASMTRSRAMLMYQDAAEKIREFADSRGRVSPLQASGSPIPTPYRSASIPPPGAAIVNGKPVVTAFAGEMQDSAAALQSVEIVELYHRDHTLIKKEVAVRDPLGAVRQEIVKDDEGMPQFEESEPEHYQSPDGGIVAIPRFKLRMEDVYEERLIRKYPFWRRTTVLLPDNVLLEDIAWDGPLPLAFYSDLEPLDGMWGRGSLLQNEHLQAVLNVGLSTVTDNLRFGSLNAWLAGNQSGLLTQQIIPGVGQVISVGDVSQVKPLTSPNLDAAFFSLLDRVERYMERIIGATGVMQGESAGRADSGSAYDTLAEIGGSRLVMDTQRFEGTLGKWAEIVGWFAQNYYTDDHALSVEDATGNVTWEKVSSPLLAGSFSYSIATGSTMAWSESAKYNRSLQEYKDGLIDRRRFYEDTKKPGWRALLARISAANPSGALGPAGSPPPRVRTSAKHGNKPPPTNIQK